MRRLFRRHRKQVEEARSYADERFNDNFFDRFIHLWQVKRFIVGWVFLVLLLPILTVFQTVNLNQYFLTSGPVPGGVYDEGIIGTYSTASPLFATSKVDASVSHLIFSGLFKYDDSNKLVSDLASNYDVDASAKKYTVHLKQNIRWHDGKPFTADDVVFTYKLIQNPDVQSPFFNSWQGIRIDKIDDFSVRFTLPNILTSFPYSLTTGIVPQHKLAGIPAEDIQASKFNSTAPIGTGPFEWDGLQFGSDTASGIATDLIQLKPYDKYHDGAPKLASFILHTYESREQLVSAYQKRAIIAIAGLETIPEELHYTSDSYVYRFPLTAETMVFFKNSEGVMKDKAVRSALQLSVSQVEILKIFDFQVTPARGPLLIGQLGYDKKFDQASYNLESAKTILDKAGWKYSEGSMIRSKEKQDLRFQLIIENTPEGRAVGTYLKDAWKKLGVEMQLVPQISADFRATVNRHDYTAVLHTISIGVDPDVFVYWDSSEADLRSANRLNFSEYNSAEADTALESGRTRSDSTTRTLKYAAFLKAWQKDVPAIALFQPNDIYITRGKVVGLVEHSINSDSDRYYSVQNWQIKTGKIPK